MLGNLEPLHRAHVRIIKKKRCLIMIPYHEIRECIDSFELPLIFRCFIVGTVGCRTAFHVGRSLFLLDELHTLIPIRHFNVQAQKAQSSKSGFMRICLVIGRLFNQKVIRDLHTLPQRI